MTTRGCLHLAPTTAAALPLSTLSAWAADAPPVYPTPQATLEVLVTALETGDADAAIRAIVPDAADLVQAADSAASRAEMKNLRDPFHAGDSFVPTEGGGTIASGADGWPLPMPLASGPQVWTFDAEMGRQEIRDRKIGSNEREVIDIFRQDLAIQSAYRLVEHDGDGVLEFAAAFFSSERHRDRLFWPGGDSPVCDIAARADLDGYSGDGGDKGPESPGGHYFRVLTGQGLAAPGDAMSHMATGNMLAGHAPLAVSAVFGETGVHPFLASEAGTINQADPGERKLETAFEIESFDSGESWEPVI